MKTLFGGKKTWLLDVILIIVMISVCILVRLNSISRNPDRFKLACFPFDNDSQCVDNYFDDNGNSYLYEFDSYYNLKQAVDFKNGIIIDGDCLLAIIFVILWRVINIVCKIDLSMLAVYIGPVIFSLSCIPIYFFVKKRSNRIGAFTAGILVNVCAAFVNYVSFARFDTDILIWPLSILSILLFISAMQDENFKHAIIKMVFGSISFLCLAYAWHSYQIYFYLIVAIAFTVCILFFVKNEFNLKKILKMRSIQVAILYPVFIIDLLFLFGKVLSFSKIIQVFQWIISGSYSGTTDVSIFPDDFKFVDELSASPILSGGVLGLIDTTRVGVVNWLGGAFLCMFVALFLVYFCYKIILFFKGKKINYDRNIILYISLLVWAIGTLIGALSGTRFLKDASVPVMIIAGLGFGMVFNKFKNGKLMKILCFLIWLIVFLPSFQTYAIFDRSVPVMNDNINKVSEYIRDNFNDDYVLMSWWDYGYYYKYATDHKIYADGGGGDSHRYWVSDALMSEDTEYSSGLFKVLANLANFDTLSNVVGSDREAVNVIHKAIYINKDVMNKWSKRQYGLDDEEAVIVSDLLYRGKKAVVVITDYMNSITSVLSYYHCWNFDILESNCERSESIANVSENGNNSTVMSRMFYETEYELDGFKFETKISDPFNNDTMTIWTTK